MDTLLKNLLSGDTTTPSQEEVEALLEKEPYFFLPALKLLRSKTHVDEETRKLFAGRIMLSVTSREDLYDMLGDDAGRFEDFYPAQKQEPMTTNRTIDTFLDRFGPGDEREMAALTKMILNPTPDYAAVLAAEEATQDGSKATTDNNDDDMSRINRFLESNPLPQPKRQDPADANTGNRDTTSRPPAEEKQDTATALAQPAPSQPQPATQLTESLARVMIKNRNYTKALEIITGLSLNNPEKSVYFADQIRFLKKLIINESKK